MKCLCGQMYEALGFQEPFSSWTHLLAAGVFAAFSVPLIRRGRTTGHRVGLGVFAFSAVFLLSMSGVYHLLGYGGGGRAVLERLDHAAIFVLIAGTFTPIHMVLFRGIMRWGMLGVIWAAAVTGLTLKTIFFDSVSETMSLSFYLGLGWAGLISGLFLWKRFGFGFIRLLLVGAMFYSIGAVLELARWPVLITGVIEAHELFHLAVLVGLGCHWQFVRHCLRRHAADMPIHQEPEAETDQAF
ncbi:MAG: hemolysin III family protein [Phycisphaeraceae bacterium]|nr:hemolysin III family protein [Phycisphaeraceae bacterium]